MAARSLKIAIIGAGLSGLSSALFLRRNGHAVTVYESKDGLSEAGAGIQVPPNSSRLLAQLGLLEMFEKVAFKTHGIQLRRYDDGRVLQVPAATPDIEKILGYPAEYLRILFEAAMAVGVVVEFGVNITAIIEHTPAIVFRDRDREVFDLIIGADGVHSFTRQSILKDSNTSPVVNSHRAYRSLIDLSTLSSTSATRSIIQSGVVNVWLGPDRHVVAYPISDSHCNMVMMHRGTVLEVHSWDQPGSLTEMRQVYADFDPQLRAVLEVITDVRAWKLLEAPHLTTWLSKSGKVVLTGDAAHAMLPFAAQGAAQGLEDAAVLAACLKYLSPTCDLRSCLETFTKLRMPRVSRVAAAARANGDAWHLKDGPEQRARDKAWKNQTEAEEQLAAVMKGSSDNMESSKLKRSLASGRSFQMWLWGKDVVAEVENLMGSGNGKEAKPNL